MVGDVRPALAHDLLQRQFQGVVPARLHEGGRPHKGVADGVWGQVTGHVVGEVGLEEGQAEFDAHLEQAERRMVLK